MGIKDEDFSLDNLSAEERAAINDGDEDDEAALAAVIEEGNKPVKAVQDDEDDAAQDDVDPKIGTPAQADDKPKSAAAADPQGQADDGNDNDADSDVGTDFQPVYVVPPVENFKERMATLTAEKSAAFKQMMDGEMSAEDYAVVEEKYLTQRDELRSAQDRFVTAEQMKEQTAQQRWMWEVDAFKKTALKDDGVDYVNDEKMNKALDRWVRVLGNDPDNAKQPSDWFLKEAHKNVKLQYSLVKQAEPVQKPGQKPRLPDLAKIPPTLGRVPAADDGDAGTNEFASLDNLTGLALEKAVAAMSVEKQDRWLAAN